MKTKAKNPVRSVRKAFEIVETLVDLNGAGVTEIAKRLDEPKSTVHNYLSTLEEEEYVYREGMTYHVGIQFLELGIHARNRFKLFTVGSPEVRLLARETGEFSNIVIEEYGHGITIFRTQGENAVRSKHMGLRSHLNCTAAGKTILAHLPKERVEEIIDIRGLPAATSNSIIERNALFEELERIRDSGVAFDNEEVLLGLRCVAAPVFSGDGGLLGSISVSGPTTRFQGDYYREELPEKVKETSNVIALNIEAT